MLNWYQDNYSIIQSNNNHQCDKHFSEHKKLSVKYFSQFNCAEIYSVWVSSVEKLEKRHQTTSNHAKTRRQSLI